MTEELLQSIRELNRRNLEQPPAPTAAAAPADAGVAALLEEIQRRLAGRVRSRIDRAVVRFAERLEALAPELSVPALDDPLQKTQEIDYQEGGSSERELLASRPPELGERLDRIEEQLTASKPVPAKDVAKAVTRQLQDQLEELAQRFEKVAAPAEGLAGAEAIARLDALQESLEAAHQSGPGREADGELSQQLAELRVLVEAALPDPGFPRTGNGTVLEELRLIGDEIRTDLKNVYTEITDHCDSVRTRSEEVAKLVTESVESLRSVVEEASGRAAPAADSADGEALTKALAQLEELRGLPEKISAMLNAADEVHQFNLDAAIQSAADDITRRLQFLLES